MRIFFSWILPLCVQSAYQRSEINCLQTNPKVLDVVFDFFYQHDSNNKNLNTTAEDIANAILLIASRFKRIHMLYRNSDKTMINIESGMSLYAKWSGKSFPLLVYPPYEKNQGTNISRIIKMYEEAKKSIMRINTDQENLPVVGLYLMHAYSLADKEGDFSQVEAVEQVFKQAKHSTLQLGHILYPCSLQNYGKNSNLKRLQFITCHLHIEYLFENPKPLSPEDYADEVIRTCDRLRDNATYLNLTVQVMCITDYPSQGATDNGLVGSVENFQTFWCRIVDELVRNKSHAGIVMAYAFDLTPGHTGSPVNDLFTQEHNTGWWRRKSFHKPGEFVEKVEELPGGNQYGKCRGPCDLCTSTNECCGDLFCAPDSSIPPYKGRPPSVCRSKEPKCNKAVELTSVTQFSSLTVTILGVSTFFLFIIVVVFLVHRRIIANNVLSRQELRQFFDGCQSSPGGNFGDNHEVQEMFQKIPYNRELEIHKSSFEIYENQILGSGEFGIVVKGRVGNDDVAVKTTLRGVDKVYFKAMLSELKVLMHLGYHEAIVNFFGANTSQLASGSLYIFLELCPLGNLLEFLRCHRNQFLENTTKYAGNPQGIRGNVLTGKTLLKWSLQIASALQYLAGKKVIHGDIAVRNVLVFSHDQVKLTDFGLSRRLYEYSNYIKKHQEPLPWRHMSVEALKDLSFSIQSDIWAFGVTMWEIFSLGEVPYPGRSCCEEFIQQLLSGLRPLRPQNTQILVYEIMTSCWTTDVKLRPPISLIYSNLTSALDQLYTEELYLNLSGIK